MLLWVWAACVFVIVDLFWNVEKFDSARPRSSLYRGMRIAAHRMVGEAVPEETLAVKAWREAPPRIAEENNVLGTVPLEGVVCGPDGRPVPDARVVARAHGYGPRTSGATGDDGRFRLAVLPGRHHQVMASKSGLVSTLQSRIVPPAHVDLVLTRGARVTGRTLDSAGRGVGGVVVRLRTVEENRFGGGLAPEAWLGKSVTSVDPDGSFVFERVPQGDCEMAIVVVGGPVHVGVDFPIGPIEGNVREDLLVERTDAVTVTGVVSDYDSRRPLAGTQVDLFPGGGVRTDRNGAFELAGVQPGLLRVEVRAGKRPPFVRVVRIREISAPLQLRVPARLTATGRVVDPQQRPVANARVRWTGPSGWRDARRTDADGRFRLDAIPPHERGLVRVEAEGFPPAEHHPRSDEFVIRLRPGACLEGRVFLPGGEPAQGVLVRVTPTPKRMDVRATRTDANGRYALAGLPSGALSAVAAPRDGSLAPVAVRVEVAPGATAEAPDVQLRRGHRLEGRVTDAGDQPLVDAVVEFHVHGFRSVTVSEARGRFVFAMPEAGARLVVRRLGYRTARVPVPPRQAGVLRIQLTPLTE